MAYLEECRIYIKPNQTVKQVFSLKTEVIWLLHSNEEDLNFSAAEDMALTLPIAACLGNKLIKLKCVDTRNTSDLMPINLINPCEMLRF